MDMDMVGLEDHLFASFNIIAITIVPEQSRSMTEAGPGRLFDEYMNTINCTSPAARASVTDIYYLHTNTRYLLSTIPRYSPPWKPRSRPWRT